MLQMNGRAFVDTNIFIYLYSEDESEKQEIAQKAINKYECVISTQVLNEFSNICIKKLYKEPK
jgi:predicted nucleic acid-binding protein